jgi:hypothetical protein
MAHHRSKPEPEYDSDDMSAGARLMRYYVSDEPQHDTLGGTNNSTARTFMQHSADISREHHVATDSRAPRSTGESASVAKSATGTEGNNNKEVQDDQDDNDEEENDDDGDDTVFRGDLADFRGDVLFEIVGRHSHHDILEKIAGFHPQATFGQKQLTWRIANAIVARSNRQGVTKLKVRAELDALRIANGVEFPCDYRPKTQAQHDGTQHATPEDGKDNGL